MSKRKGRNISRQFVCVADLLCRYKSVHTRQLVDIEDEFLHAAEFGDVPTVKQLVDRNADLNVDCIDALGRTALRLAVKNEHLEVSTFEFVCYCEMHAMKYLWFSLCVFSYIIQVAMFLVTNVYLERV